MRGLYFLPLDKPKMKIYTGLTFCQFLVIFRFLGSAVDNLIYWRRERKHVGDTKRRGPMRIMTPQNELILTLNRLRLGFFIRQLSDMFDISETQVVSVVITWITFMHVQFKQMDRKFLPSASQMKKQ